MVWDSELKNEAPWFRAKKFRFWLANDQKGSIFAAAKQEGRDAERASQSSLSGCDAEI